MFDAVGGPLAEAILAGLCPQAAFVSYGLLSGKPFTVPATAPSPRRFHLRDRLESVEASVWQGWFAELWPKVRQVIMPESASFRLAEWRRALEMFETSGRQAKPMLDLR